LKFGSIIDYAGIALKEGFSLRIQISSYLMDLILFMTALATEPHLAAPSLDL
jgi:hypothetical protein